MHTLIPLLHFCLSIVYMYPSFFLSKCAGDINAIYLPLSLAAAFKWLFCADVMQGILCSVPLFVVVRLLFFFFFILWHWLYAIIIATISHDEWKEKLTEQTTKVQATFLTLFLCESCIASLHFFSCPLQEKDMTAGQPVSRHKTRDNDRALQMEIWWVLTTKA